MSRKKAVRRPAAAAASKRAEKKPRERKPGATGGELVTACRNCGSTDRTAYTDRREMQHGGVDPQAGPYTHVVWQNTKCVKCGQARIDRHVENRDARD